MAKLTKAGREILERMASGIWRPLYRTDTGYFLLCMGTMKDGATWCPRGRTGATVAALLKARYLRLRNRQKITTAVELALEEK
jgi:hypothetical protein